MKRLGPDAPIGPYPDLMLLRTTRVAVRACPVRAFTTIRQVLDAGTALHDPGNGAGIGLPMRSLPTSPGSTTSSEPFPSHVIEAVRRSVCPPRSLRRLIDRTAPD